MPGLFSFMADRDRDELSLSTMTSALLTALPVVLALLVFAALIKPRVNRTANLAILVTVLVFLAVAVGFSVDKSTVQPRLISYATAAVTIVLSTYILRRKKTTHGGDSGRAS